MALRRRMIQSTIWQDPEFGSMSVLAELIFIGMITLADDEGRLRVHPSLLKSQLFPYDLILSVESVLEAEEEISRVCRNVCFYEIKGELICQFLKWHTHQTLRGDRIQPSLLPAPPQDIEIYRILKTVDGKNEPLKIEIAKRDKMCRYCGVDFPSASKDWVLEHVIPKRKGGETNLENCVLACSKCNTKKSDRTPEEAKMPLLSLSDAVCGEVLQSAPQGKGIEGNRREVKQKGEVVKNSLSAIDAVRAQLEAKGLLKARMKL